MLRTAIHLALGLAAAAAAADGQLASQCRFINLSTGRDSPSIVYTAKCARTVGGPLEVCSQLDLACCLTNHDGTLEAPVDMNTVNFADTCPGCHVDAAGVNMVCLCRQMNGTYGHASVDLSMKRNPWCQTTLIMAVDHIIVVQDGTLTCSTTIGKEVSECPVTWIGPPRRRG
ncbi:hypothetical protein RJ55_06671 [Drechmeria coniospora]|nr:hypothetical protein RJ55_06671 [Drechmeria coniospora]